MTVITPRGDVDLASGSLLIGRLPECDIHLEDNLVSRRHARISVRDGSVVLEDLHSANGVYVNGLQIDHCVPLREGDRILIGTVEISLFESRDASLTRLRVAPSAAAKPAAPSRASASRDNVPATLREGALKMIGSLADRLAAAGNLEEAAQVLSGHLRRILKGANSGLVVPADVATTASHHALTLARWTQQALWVDYVVELHLSARLLMNAVTLAEFEDAISKLGCDRMLLDYYVEGLKSQPGSLEPGAERRLDRLKSLSEKRR